MLFYRFAFAIPLWLFSLHYDVLIEFFSGHDLGSTDIVCLAVHFFLSVVKLSNFINYIAYKIRISPPSL